MPLRPHLLSAAVLASALTAGSAWYFHTGTGSKADLLFVPSAQKTATYPTGAFGGREGDLNDASASTGRRTDSGRYGTDYRRASSIVGGTGTGGHSSLETPYGRALPGTTSGGRGLFAPSGTKATSRNEIQVSEAELQWRAAQVEQEANHDLKRLVKLLDLDEDQQDRIFQTLASRSADWHPMMRTTTVFPDFPRDQDSGNTIATNLPPGPGSDPAATVNDPASTGKTTSSNPAAPEPPAPGNGNVAANAPETPLTDALAADLTPEQKAALAEEEMDREEWWESIIPRLLPDEEELESDPDTGSDGVYAVPPDAGTSTGSSSPDTAGGVGASAVFPTPSALQ